MVARVAGVRHSAALAAAVSDGAEAFGRLDDCKPAFASHDFPDVISDKPTV